MSPGSRHLRTLVRAPWVLRVASALALIALVGASTGGLGLAHRLLDHAGHGHATADHADHDHAQHAANDHQGHDHAPCGDSDDESEHHSDHDSDHHSAPHDCQVCMLLAAGITPPAAPDAAPVSLHTHARFLGQGVFAPRAVHRALPPARGPPSRSA